MWTATPGLRSRSARAGQASMWVPGSPLSAVDSDRCPSYPSCSSYSVAAFKKHGFVMGWLMTVDRLIHEGDEASMSPLVYENGHVKIFDPVENNDFWWSCKDGK
jgi:hypothetical protein